MNTRLGLAATALAMALAAPAIALDRGDTAYICYDRHSGFMWAKQKHSCQLMVLEKIGSRFRVEFLENCYFTDWDKGDRELLNASQLYSYRCN